MKLLDSRQVNSHLPVALLQQEFGQHAVVSSRIEPVASFRENGLAIERSAKASASHQLYG